MSTPRNPVPHIVALVFALASAAPAGAIVPFSAVGNVALPDPNAIAPEDDRFGSSIAVGDFNDDLRHLGPGQLAARLRDQLAPEDARRFLSSG